MPTLFFLLYATSLCLSLVLADYTIDDSNYSTLKFSENPAGPVWGPFGSDTGEVMQIRLSNGTMQTVDATQCYDGTYTYAACSASNNCQVEFSFTGSGITIYVLRAGPQGMSASLSVDSGTATTATLDAPPAPQYYIPRVVLFNVQNIPSGTHTAVMTVLDWNGGFSGMMLDYIDVNQAEVAATSTSPKQSSSTSSPTSTNSQASSQGSATGTQTSSGTPSVASIISVLSSQSSGVATPTSSGNGTTNPTSKKTNVAAAVGGGVGGGVGLLALIGLIILCFRRRDRRNRQTQNESPHPFLPQSEATFTNTDTPSINRLESSASPSVSPTRTFGVTRPMQSWSDSEAGSTPNFTARGQTDSSQVTNIVHARVASSGNDGVSSFVPVSTSTPAQLAQPALRLGSTALPVNYRNEKSEPAPGTLGQDRRNVLDTNPDATLTDEQADFVNGLFNNNVPAPVIARVLERMLANPHGANSTGANDPELRARLDPSNLPAPSQTPSLRGGPWPSAMSDLGDGETTTGTAPPSYDYARAQPNSRWS